VTRPGELRYDPPSVRWEVRCAECPERWVIAPWIADEVHGGEQSADYLTGRGWRCLGARWHCPGCV
jgi:hypothetical protein